MKHRKQTAPKTLRPRLSVVPLSDGWAIAGASPARRGRASFKTQREAVAAARRMIETRAGGELTIHSSDGRIRSVDTYALGESSFDKISAVEGIHLSEEMKRDFGMLERRKYSPEKRREWLIAKYGSKGNGIRRGK